MGIINDYCKKKNDQLMSLFHDINFLKLSCFYSFYKLKPYFLSESNYLYHFHWKLWTPIAALLWPLGHGITVWTNFKLLHISLLQYQGIWYFNVKFWIFIYILFLLWALSDHYLAFMLWIHFYMFYTLLVVCFQICRKLTMNMACQFWLNLTSRGHRFKLEYHIKKNLN